MYNPGGIIRVIAISGETYYACGECGLIYRNRETARECESWCSKHNTCNVEIECRDSQARCGEPGPGEPPASQRLAPLHPKPLD
ncbi:MAG: hypothetical protein GSR73_00575 [Desulfurococcales archaeon]|nr:hypothetical protein [Desulfurococcales archaeon]